MPVIQQHKSATFKNDTPLILENGNVLQNLSIRYTTFGRLNSTKSNVAWVFHPLTADSNPFEWWAGVVGEHGYINSSDHFVICANVIGSCYGSIEPTDFTFPLLTIRDMVNAHKSLRCYLGIEKIKLGIGGSMGGQQLLQWAVDEPNLFEVIVPIATNAKHSAWGIAFNETQRMAIKTASNFSKGLEVARAVAMLSYRNKETYNLTQNDTDGRVDDFSAASYQRYQGVKLSRRFSPFSYYYLSKSMDSHHVGLDKKSGLKGALSKIQSRAIVIGIETDILFPISEQKFISNHIPDSSFFSVQSLYGHDGFLIESKHITSILRRELDEKV